MPIYAALSSPFGVPDATVGNEAGGEGAVFIVDPSIATLRARLGAYSQHSRHSSVDTTAAARAAFLSKFELEVDPDKVLPEAERQRRAEAARKAYFTRLALKSVQAKRRRKGQNRRP